MPSITTSSQCCTRGLRKYKKIRKLNNKRKIERKEIKLLFTGDLIIQIENLRDSTDKLVILRSKFARLL